ncbi:Procollagen-lysine,2-oxoglutarate 5-dioxygenase 1 [Oryzias melastigma]|uniref:Procollagen-lysine,2-oxoglutarate 5-dioxygenase 1 n=1 Tax=Oryzias melastigma TaxID=30732 RepID=A0A834CIX3_ORYME|nr:Procollagen-lysine,2-oxoglutarate 5-dioxygenase 1 [Oryzias melastigma]
MRAAVFLAWFCSLLLLAAGEQPRIPEEKLLVLTVATEETDGFRRFLRSARNFNYTVKVLGRGQKWSGGDFTTAPGGGQKVRLLKEALQEMESEDQVLLFTDSYDAVFASGPKELLRKFQQAKQRVVFSSERLIWPDRHLEDKHPHVREGNRFLGSGGFMGYLSNVKEMVADWTGEDGDSDQLFFTKIYIDPDKRKSFNITVDNKCRLFQNLHGALDDVVLKFEDGRVRARNVLTSVSCHEASTFMASGCDSSLSLSQSEGRIPVHLSGNQYLCGDHRHKSSRLVFQLQINYLGNYIPNSWTFETGCTTCQEDLRPLAALKDSEYPLVSIGIFIQQPTPFVSVFFERLLKLQYPKNRLKLFVYNQEPHHEHQVSSFLQDHGGLYRDVRSVTPEEDMDSAGARDLALDICRKDQDCEYFFNLDVEVVLKNENTLKILIEQNLPVVAPMITRAGRLWSNFWGAVSADGYYARSEDYVDIVQGRRVSQSLDPDMAFCHGLRSAGVFMFVTNMQTFGRILSTENYRSSHLHNDLWQIFENPVDWEERYIHENYSRIMKDQLIETPCPDVYWFPVFSDIACDHLVEEMEHFGKWSGGGQRGECS